MQTHLLFKKDKPLHHNQDTEQYSYDYYFYFIRFHFFFVHTQTTIIIYEFEPMDPIYQNCLFFHPNTMKKYSQYTYAFI